MVLVTVTWAVETRCVVLIMTAGGACSVWSRVVVVVVHTVLVWVKVTSCLLARL